jgi:hypothetical protein
MRNHGVTAEWIRNVREHGYKDLTVDQLIEMRSHGVPGKGVV